jgi:dTDP-4-dehydrorhamnose 3,5-epimerase
MIFTATTIDGAFLIRPERFEDERGFFARLYCPNELAARGLDPRIVQRSVSYNRRRGTLRGMHFQVAPHEENKIVSSLTGSIWDVIVDLRRASPTYRRWFGATLTGEGLEALFVPAGCAHGFITLADETRVHYEISEFHHPESARGVRYDDPAFGIEWPIEPVIMAARDRAYPSYVE